MPGWKRRNRTVSAVLCWLAAAAAHAVSPQDGQPEADTRTLPEAFPVFLGEWQDPQGNWQDPLVFEGPGWAELDKDAEQSNETD